MKITRREADVLVFIKEHSDIIEKVFTDKQQLEQDCVSLSIKGLVESGTDESGENFLRLTRAGQQIFDALEESDYTIDVEKVLTQ